MAVADTVDVEIKVAVAEAVATTTLLTITTTMAIKDKVAEAASTTTPPRTTRIKGIRRDPLTADTMLITRTLSKTRRRRCYIPPR